jgi:hypothetical protein
VIWDARKIDDYTLHRRRFVLAVFTSVLAIGLVALRLSDIAERGWEIKDWVAAAVWLLLAVYVGRNAASELRAMRRSVVSGKNEF